MRKRSLLSEQPSYVLHFVPGIFSLVMWWKLSWRLTFLLTPWSRVLLEKLTGFAAGQEIPRIFRTRRFITVLTSARKWTCPIQAPNIPCT